MKRRASENLRIAAENLFKNHAGIHRSSCVGCCETLCELLHIDPYELAFCATEGRYLNMFKPKRKGLWLYWWGDPSDQPDTNERVFALLLAAEMAESDGN